MKSNAHSINACQSCLDFCDQDMSVALASCFRDRRVLMGVSWPFWQHWTSAVNGSGNRSSNHISGGILPRNLSISIGPRCEPSTRTVSAATVGTCALAEREPKLAKPVVIRGGPPAARRRRLRHDWFLSSLNASGGWKVNSSAGNGSRGWTGLRVMSLNMSFRSLPCRGQISSLWTSISTRNARHSTSVGPQLNHLPTNHHSPIFRQFIRLLISFDNNLLQSNIDIKRDSCGFLPTSLSPCPLLSLSGQCISLFLSKVTQWPHAPWSAHPHFEATITP